MAYKQEPTRQVQLEDTVTDSTKKGVTANGIKQALENVQPAGNYARGNIYRYGDGSATIEAEDIMMRATHAGFYVEADDEIEFSGREFRLTTNGDVNVETTNGAIDVTTNNGDMNVEVDGAASVEATGTLNIRSANGNANVTAEEFRLTTNGDVNVETTDGAIDVTTNNGDMNVEVDGAASVEATGTLNIRSANGNANVTAEELVTVRAQTQDLNLEAGENVNVKAGENGDLNIKKEFDGTTETYPLFGEVLRERVEVDDAVANHALQANQLTIFTSRTSALTLTLAAGATHTEFILPKEYHFFVVTGATAPTVTFPVGITWAGGAPTIAANKTYEFSIQEGVAIGIEA